MNNVFVTTKRSGQQSAKNFRLRSSPTDKVHSGILCELGKFNCVFHSVSVITFETESQYCQNDENILKCVDIEFYSILVFDNMLIV